MVKDEHIRNLFKISIEQTVNRMTKNQVGEPSEQRKAKESKVPIGYIDHEFVFHEIFQV